MSALLLMECEDGSLVDGALSAAHAAHALGPFVALVCGSDARRAAEQVARLPGAERVLALEGAPRPDGLPRAEAAAPMLVDLLRRFDAAHLVAASSAWARGVLPRTAALLDVTPLSDVVRIIDACTFVRPVHAGAALMTLRSEEPIQVLTVRSSAFEFAVPDASREPAPIDVLAPPAAPTRSSRLLERHLPDPTGTPGLTGARIVVSGGRGLGSAEGFARLLPLARALGAAVGASRAAVDAGYAPADAQVGQTGKSVAPDLYIALGISGAIQHWAGMKDSKTIVAVNKDPEAPVFQFADYGLVADLFEVLAQLEEQLA